MTTTWGIEGAFQTEGRSSRKRGVAVGALRVGAVLASLMTVTSIVRADDDGPKCQHFDGPFSSVTVAPPECTSPVGLCTHGLLTGEFVGTYDFTVETLTPSPSDPTTLILTGHSVVTTKNGVMLTNDVSILHTMGPTTPSPFVTTAVVASGDHHWRATTGQFVATGSLVLATGEATGSFTADLCRDRGEEGDDGS
ncbi:MAG: hypothetical protein ACRENE_10135 [Polyangiaceae bacterium]